MSKSRRAGIEMGEGRRLSERARTAVVVEQRRVRCADRLFCSRPWSAQRTLRRYDRPRNPRPLPGEAVTIGPDEVPVFWACGVTPMEAIIHAKPDLAITHEPGHMFVTDVLDSSLRG